MFGRASDVIGLWLLFVFSFHNVYTTPAFLTDLMNDISIEGLTDEIPQQCHSLELVNYVKNIKVFFFKNAFKKKNSNYNL